VDEPVTLRHRPEAPSTIVPPELTVQFSLASPSQVLMSAVVLRADESPVTLRQRLELFPTMVPRFRYRHHLRRRPR
jgi:hypothetical protein